ncbi:MAG: hypothetical protein ACXACF_04675 [Candidatus Hermodarchaeia archaeon]|jgi:tRNA G37 N-methylase Trm5
MTCRQEVIVGATHDVHTSTPGRLVFNTLGILREDLLELAALHFWMITQIQVKKISNHRHITFSQFLQKRLGAKIPPELLPRRLRILGHVAILWLNPKTVEHKSLIGQTVLEYDSKIQSVLRRTSAISGPYRQPAVELIALQFLVLIDNLRLS